ncbi:diaminopimelate decarboxylase [Motilimonas cestriensis]|uniref:Diaminopimelate decarboxylase n=1 Tax=Motilimonas cestriensis TaxID=2742685 RepID=A0ABS8WCR6_9GAMM|nr:diaminopimelate decarboxylase [Motilimonas cestriensis]MCE2596117.1 diaminopimelate decarboxylase [Motilimonas cestriensis]
MDFFNYQEDGRLFAEDLAVEDVIKQSGTPAYIYSRATIERHWHAFDQAAGDHPHMICYAVKANSNLGVLNLMAKLGSGFDIVSVGELLRVLKAGGDPQKVVFSGVGKTELEIRTALEAGIYCFNVESEGELLRINEVAALMGKKAPVSIRVNPNIDAGTHPYISTGLKENKFGIDIEKASAIYQIASALENIEVKGVDCHIGSQLTEIEPFIEAIDKLLVLIDNLKSKGIEISHLDVGGGLGVPYNGETPPQPAEYTKALKARLGDRKLKLLFEPGRAIMANAGILVSKVEFLKLTEHKNFAIVDAAMNDLIRPALYSAWQRIEPMNLHADRETRNYDVVGPICETGDFLGKDRDLAIAEGDYVVVRSAGAYGSTMASNYNSRCRPAEIMVDGDQAYLVRARETHEDLWKGENVLPS